MGLEAFRGQVSTVLCQTRSALAISEVGRPLVYRRWRRELRAARRRRQLRARCRKRHQ